MKTGTPAHESIDAYINDAPASVRPTLERIRQTIRAAAPDAQEIISYRMPAFKRVGILVYFAAFKAHIGIYPPVSGDPALVAALAPYSGPKGNLKFPINESLPYELITRLVRHKVSQEIAKPAAGKRKRS